ncbi:hypothetical protein GGD67_003140 [Bradyrhizobium sp. IAR9]|nr:hypothetical protein [Bradyrhizobium sp. IAR9]
MLANHEFAERRLPASRFRSAARAFFAILPGPIGAVVTARSNALPLPVVHVQGTGHIPICSVRGRLAQAGRDVAVRAMAVALISFSLLACGVSPSVAQEDQSFQHFIWQRDESNGMEVAMSTGEPAFNFFDVGNLSPNSLYLVQQVLGDISRAAGKKVDRSLTSSSIAVFHDTNVFLRLKNDRAAFTTMGIPEHVIDDLKGRITDDARCLSHTRTDAKGNVIFTVILLSERFNDCLVSGLNYSFGIRASNVSIATLLSVCVLYEGRNRGLRDRQSLSREAPKLRDLCLAKADAHSPDG